MTSLVGGGKNVASNGVAANIQFIFEKAPQFRSNNRNIKCVLERLKKRCVDYGDTRRQGIKRA